MITHVAGVKAPSNTPGVLHKALQASLAIKAGGTLVGLHINYGRGSPLGLAFKPRLAAFENWGV